jgi:YD repeat-containing protein
MKNQGRAYALAAALLWMIPSAFSQQANVTYEYDALGRITKATNSGGMAVGYSYDPAGNRTEVTPAGPPDAVNDSIAVAFNKAYTCLSGGIGREPLAAA